MQENSWIFVIDANELADGEKKPVLVEDNKILLIKTDGVFYAMSNKCPHMGCPLSKGVLEGSVITCSCHDWQFDVKSGQFLTAKEIKVPVYDTKVSDNKLFVNLEGANK
ncbi:Rieske (2Fe-2S) protein [Methanolobus sp. ZRKC3]|uniref:Rieske (2Fe-2S) protein n=1 Tax=Methanolobus sp. ZRKC3 TaxID=3125786 RepID=UPI00324CE36D